MRIYYPTHFASLLLFTPKSQVFPTFIPFSSRDSNKLKMASLTMVFPPVMTGRATGQVYAATAAKGGSKEEKGLLDWIIGGLAKEDQLLEVDPILKKVEGKNGTVVVPPKKKEGGFGGLFAKKD